MRLKDLILTGLLLGFGLLRLLTRGSKLTPRAAATPGSETRPHPGTLITKAVAAIITIGLVLAGLAAVVVIYSGLYPMAADIPRPSLTSDLFATLKRSYVQRQARDIPVPQLRDAALVQQGFILHREHCVVCHGAPGVANEQIGRGIDPLPPNLATAVTRWSEAETYVILTHGLRMSGMPSFGVVLSESERWSVVAFLRQLPWLSPFEYRSWAKAFDDKKPEMVEWVIENQSSLIRLTQDGDPARGRELVQQYGCGACHVIPGIGLGTGTVGPPLTRFGERQYIAGTLANTPDNMVAWIVNPQRINPRTAMPNTGVTPDEAFHMAAYLYDLKDSARLVGLRRER